jgi:hypothetical protein
MSDDESESSQSPNVKLRLQHGAVALEFIPKNGKTKTESEVQSEVHEILTQMYIRSRMRTRAKPREGVLADAA